MKDKLLIHADNMYSLCSSSECSCDCIFFDKEKCYCHIGEEHDKKLEAIMDNPVLFDYLKTLQKAYERYCENKFKCENEGLKEMSYYWSGMADSIQALFNDLGLGYYL